jgi:hypothetical protein
VTSPMGPALESCSPGHPPTPPRWRPGAWAPRPPSARGPAGSSCLWAFPAALQ